MRRPKPYQQCFAAFLAGAFAVSGAAQDQTGKASPAEFSAEVGIGGEYDSNVSVEEVDATSGEGDYALNMDLGLEANKGLSQDIDLSATYDFSQTLYDEFSQVDRQTHILGTALTINSDVIDSDLSFYYINSRLDGEKFLELYRVSPAVSGFLARKWFARGAYVYSDK